MDKNTNIHDFLVLAEFLNSDEVMALIQELPKPERLCGIAVPEDLNQITFGQLCELREIANTDNLIFTPAKVLLCLTEEQIVKESFADVLGFSNWVSKEVIRINTLFASTNTEPTPEEVRAGINELSFGSFGIVDYFAKRMGFSNHDDVMSIPWVRIYKCLDMDSKTTKFEKRLRKEHETKK